MKLEDRNRLARAIAGAWCGPSPAETRELRVAALACGLVDARAKAIELPDGSDFLEVMAEIRAEPSPPKYFAGYRDVTHEAEAELAEMAAERKRADGYALPASPWHPWPPPPATEVLVWLRHGNRPEFGWYPAGWEDRHGNHIGAVWMPLPSNPHEGV